MKLNVLPDAFCFHFFKPALCLIVLKIRAPGVLTGGENISFSRNSKKHFKVIHCIGLMKLKVSELSGSVCEADFVPVFLANKCTETIVTRVSL